MGEKMRTGIALAAGVALSCIASLTLAADKPIKESAQTTLDLYVNAAEAWQMLQQDPTAVLIDVRDPVEVKFTGFAKPTKIHVPWMVADISSWSDKKSSWTMKKNPDFEKQLMTRFEQLGISKTTPVIVMCRSGSTRSAPVVNLLAQKGFTQAWTVVDGFEGSTLKEGHSKGVRAVNGWRNSDLPWSYKIDPAVAWKP